LEIHSFASRSLRSILRGSSVNHFLSGDSWSLTKIDSNSIFHLLREIEFLWLMMMIHVLHYQFLLGLIRLLFDGDHFLCQRSLALLIYSLLEYVLLDSIEGVLIRHIHSCMSLSL